MVLHTFAWNLSSASKVFVTGSFDQWQGTIELERTSNGFEKTIDLPESNDQVFYKYIVDGKRMTDPSAPSEPTSSGELNNVLKLPQPTLNSSNDKPPSSEPSQLPTKPLDAPIIKDYPAANKLPPPSPSQPDAIPPVISNLNNTGSLVSNTAKNNRSNLKNNAPRVSDPVPSIAPSTDTTKRRSFAPVGVAALDTGFQLPTKVNPEPENFSKLIDEKFNTPNTIFNTPAKPDLDPAVAITKPDSSVTTTVPHVPSAGPTKVLSENGFSVPNKIAPDTKPTSTIPNPLPASGLGKVSESVNKLNGKVTESVRKLSGKAMEPFSKSDTKLVDPVSKLSENIDTTTNKLESKVTQTTTRLSDKASKIPTKLDNRVSDASSKISDSVAKVTDKACNPISEAEKGLESAKKTPEKVSEPIAKIVNSKKDISENLTDKSDETITKISNYTSNAMDENVNTEVKSEAIPIPSITATAPTSIRHTSDNNTDNNSSNETDIQNNGQATEKMVKDAEKTFLLEPETKESELKTAHKLDEAPSNAPKLPLLIPAAGALIQGIIPGNSALDLVSKLPIEPRAEEKPEVNGEQDPLNQNSTIDEPLPTNDHEETPQGGITTDEIPPATEPSLKEVKPEEPSATLPTNTAPANAGEKGQEHVESIAESKETITTVVNQSKAEPQLTTMPSESPQVGVNNSSTDVAGIGTSVIPHEQNRTLPLVKGGIEPTNPLVQHPVTTADTWASGTSFPANLPSDPFLKPAQTGGSGTESHGKFGAEREASLNEGTARSHSILKVITSEDSRNSLRKKLSSGLQDGLNDEGGKSSKSEYRVKAKSSGFAEQFRAEAPFEEGDIESEPEPGNKFSFLTLRKKLKSCSSPTGKFTKRRSFWKKLKKRFSLTGREEKGERETSE